MFPGDINMMPSFIVYVWLGLTGFYLEDAHAEGVAKDFMRFGVEAVADLRRQDEQLERVVLVDVHLARLADLLHLPHALLPVAAVFIRDDPLKAIFSSLIQASSNWLKRKFTFQYILYRIQLFSSNTLII